MKKFKNRVTRGIKGIVFLLILASVVMCLDKSLKLVQEDNLCPRYYKYKDGTFDVAFLGASLVMYGIYPMELYDEFGIASYNLSTGNQSLEASYYLAKEVIEKDHPSLIVLDCSRAWHDEETMDSQYIHYITDTMPYLNRNRIDMIRELSPEDADLKPLLFPLIAFHTRWQELTFEDALPQAKEMVYGAKVTGRVEVSEPFDEAKSYPNTLTESSRMYIEKTVELCRENNTEILLVTMPVIGKNKFFDQHGFNLRKSAAEDVTNLARELGVKHLDYFGQVEELGLDLEKDAYDGEHLNRWGAAKFTKVLGQAIKDNYDVPDRRGEEGVYTELDEDLAAYPLSRMRDSLNRSLFLRDYAATLKSDAHDEPVEDAIVLITLNGKVDSAILSEDAASLLQGFGISQDLHSWEGHGWIAVIDGGKVVYETTPEKLRQNKLEADTLIASDKSGKNEKSSASPQVSDDEEETGEATEEADDPAAEAAEADAAEEMKEAGADAGEEAEAETLQTDEAEAEKETAEAQEEETAAAEDGQDTGSPEEEASQAESVKEDGAGSGGEFVDYMDFLEGESGKVHYSITSGRIEEEDGAVHSAASIVVNGLEYAATDRGIHFAVFNKTTGELMDTCWLNIYSYALSCTHDNH